MTEFEKRSLELQEQTSRIQKLALEEQQRAAQEQLSFQKKVESKKKAEELAKITTSFEKVKEGCSQLAIEVQPSECSDEWSTVDDDAVRKAMSLKDTWLKKIDSLKDEFLRYKTLVSTWAPGDLEDEESDYCELRDHLETAQSAVEESVQKLEKEDTRRNLFTLQKELGSKIEFPKFSGKFSECFIKFREKMERALKVNRVPKVDQVDKLRENLSGLALTLVPDSVKDIDVAFQALHDQWGDSERVLNSRLKELSKLGPLPSKDGSGGGNYQKQVQWYLTLDGLLQDLVDLADRDEELADEVFRRSTLREVARMLPARLQVKLYKLPGKKREKFINVNEKLKEFRGEAQILDKNMLGEGGGKFTGGGVHQGSWSWWIQ